jgi:hypothetical protein
MTAPGIEVRLRSAGRWRSLGSVGRSERSTEMRLPARVSWRQAGIVVFVLVTVVLFVVFTFVASANF